MSKVIIVLKIIFGLPVYYFSKIFPKDEDLAVIGSSLGGYFADNTKYYYLKHYDSKASKKAGNLIWISKNKQVVLSLKSMGLPAKYLYSFSGLYTVLRASKAYLSHQLADISGPLLGGAQIVQLWHGMALRKIGYGADWVDNNFKGKMLSFVSKWFPYAYYMKCDVLYVPCQIAKENAIEAFSKSFRNEMIAENIYLARQAKTLSFDQEFDLAVNLFPEIEELKSLDKKYDKIVAWLPTHRTVFEKSILDIISDSKLDLNKLNDFFKSQNSLFVIKAHFLDFDKISGITQNLNFIYVYPHPDPYPLLKFTDILITDYSSVFFDFLLLDRPIIFMAHDFEEYSSRMGFYYDYKNLEIGSICKSWQSTTEVILDIFNGNDDFAKKRRAKLKMFDFAQNYDTI